ncbi:hypothetical protein BGAFAR04_Ab0050 (plasmid) [Borreliella garinii Far04]|nr:hypothetical protein BGAFAR04_Ab0050 [Borreliella garinii Far04]
MPITIDSMSFSDGLRRINTPKTITITKIIAAIGLISFRLIRSSVILIVSIFQSFILIFYLYIHYIYISKL